MFFRTLAVAAAVGSALAQRPANISICDYYTTALLTNNTAANQKTLLTLVVNTAVIGNYTKPNVGIKVPGILAPAMINGTAVNLAPYFTGALLSTNTGGSMGVSQNFLDGGAATPLTMNMPANDTTSNQYFLLTHLYEFFGVLTGCSMQGGADYSAYKGVASMYEVHKFMDLGYAEVSYFVEQVGMSAASFGVTSEDVMTVGEALMGAFGYRCEPAITIVKAQGAQLQSICVDSTCPLSPNSTCSLYNSTIGEPGNATSGTATGTATGTGSTSTSTSSSPATASKAAGTTLTFSFAAVAGGLAALFL